MDKKIEEQIIKEAREATQRAIEREMAKGFPTVPTQEERMRKPRKFKLVTK